MVSARLPMLVQLVLLLVGNEGANSVEPEWGLDTTRYLPASAFLRMHNTIVLLEPYMLGDVPNHTIIGQRVDGFQLNRYMGAAHALCYSTVVTERPAYDFRVCASHEILALTAIKKLPNDTDVAIFSSSDGDDFDSGKVLHTVMWYRGPKDGRLKMQTFTGADDETDMGGIEGDSDEDKWYSYDMPENKTIHDFDTGVAYHKLKKIAAYCCSGVYTRQEGEGATR